MVVGYDVWNVVLLKIPLPSNSPALYEGPHPAVSLWSDSQYCSASHIPGKDNPGLLGSGADWDRQSCQGKDVHLTLRGRAGELRRKKNHPAEN